MWIYAFENVLSVNCIQRTLAEIQIKFFESNFLAALISH